MVHVLLQGGLNGVLAGEEVSVGGGDFRRPPQVLDIAATSLTNSFH
ncbi:hypothetical protein ACFWA4_14665 [Streptomyces sp. NPDC060011]